MNPNEIVQIISSFYDFLVTNQFLPASAIKRPPQGGSWPQEYRETFRQMGKSEEVVDLLCHLPYIDDTQWEWLHETKAINYVSRANLMFIKDHYESQQSRYEPSGEKIPPHVFSLTDGKLYGSWLLLDIRAGTITEFSVLGGRYYEVTEERFVNGTVWQVLYPTKPIGEFIAICREKMLQGSPASSV